MKRMYQRLVSGVAVLKLDLYGCTDFPSPGSIAKAVESVEKLLASDVHTALLPGVVTRMPRVVMRCQAGGDGAPDPPVEAASRQTARGPVGSLRVSIWYMVRVREQMGQT